MNKNKVLSGKELKDLKNKIIDKLENSPIYMRNHQFSIALNFDEVETLTAMVYEFREEDKMDEKYFKNKIKKLEDKINALQNSHYKELRKVIFKGVNDRIKEILSLQKQLEDNIKIKEEHLKSLLSNYRQQFERMLSQKYIKELLDSQLLEKYNNLNEKYSFLNQSINKQVEIRLYDLLKPFLSKLDKLENKIDCLEIDIESFMGDEE